MNNNNIKFWRYSIPPIDGEGWGIFLLDSTGMFAAVTDYGNYAYMWLLRHTGCDDFREFFDHKDGYYVLGKCAPSRGKEFQGRETEQMVREEILRLRWEHQITEQQARNEWELVDSIDFYYSEGFHEWYQQTTLEEAHELAVYGYNASEKAFAEILLPRFCDVVSAELANERNQTK